VQRMDGAHHDGPGTTVDPHLIRLSPIAALSPRMPRSGSWTGAWLMANGSSSDHRCCAMIVFVR